MDSKITPRKYYLDWLRVLAIMTVFILHCGRPFDTDDWHIKNAVTYAGMMAWATLLALWIMPLIFLISGSSLFYSVGRGRPGRFVKDKVMRLLVPLVVGVFTYSILGVYLDRLSHGTFQGSFFAFLPHYFDGLFPYGNFAWMGLHLWYLEWLFVYTIVLFPLFLWLKKGGGQRLLAGLGAFLARPGAVFLLALPGIVLGLILNPSSLLLGNRGWGGLSISCTSR